jgi:predicted transcriptional regulator
LKAELICPEENGNCYTTTERGRIFLDKYEEHLEHSKRLRQEAEKINHEKELLDCMTREKDAR